MSVGDIYEVKHKYKDPDQKDMENVYFYRYEYLRGLGIIDDAEALAVGFKDTIYGLARARLPVNFGMVSIDVRNLFDPAEQFSLPLAENGQRALGSENLPSYFAAKAIMSTQNGLVKKGRKMLAGFLEGDQVNGILTAAGQANALVATAAMALWIIDSIALGAKSFVPVVVKRVRSGTPGNYTYRLPETAVEAVYGQIQSAIISVVTTTQNSRKD